jgi:hypothetical protein
LPSDTLEPHLFLDTAVFDRFSLALPSSSSSLKPAPLSSSLSSLHKVQGNDKHKKDKPQFKGIGVSAMDGHGVIILFLFRNICWKN